MKAIMVMYDSLNLNILSPYGNAWIKTPNFDRLAQNSVMFENNFVGSMPCMPARRELHTGRCNFLHRSWGPIEPFDDSMPEILKSNGIHSHLVSDHQHYWEDGGATYHNRYSTWECVRGQEGDKWKADLTFKPDLKSGFINEIPQIADQKMNSILNAMKINDQINRTYLDTEDKQPQSLTFNLGLEFLEKNHCADNFFLQIETFDPHEPFYTLQQYKDLYPHEYEGLLADWPPYAPVAEGENENFINHVRLEYAALVSMCDKNLGKVLDFMDEHKMWEDTMLIVNTDHGYLLGEHGWWAKSTMPLYAEIAHTPLFIYDPRYKIKGETRAQLTQTIDLPVTLLSLFNLPIPKDMQGHDIGTVIKDNATIRDYAMYGYHGGSVNITDGNYSYFKAPKAYENSPLNEYTLMPTHMRAMFGTNELQNIELSPPFAFTKGCKTMKIDATGVMSLSNACNFGTKLFDISVDKFEKNELDNPEVESKMLKLLIRAMKENETPFEQFERLGIVDDETKVDKDYILALRKLEKEIQTPKILTNLEWTKAAINLFTTLVGFSQGDKRETLIQGLVGYVNGTNTQVVDAKTIREFAKLAIPASNQPMVNYFLNLSERVG